ncbi:MAG: hypothetical protein COT73_03255 [Bdellovibrio sp. CG10_big_fil_rev_8_21_14_0_10_47_8]|nr:MAG: hypothetical protein COT73_03255 [Bdellovibrio sp. CG10_big_fil_rev_8_21_14_0_10_47_8]
MRQIAARTLFHSETRSFFIRRLVCAGIGLGLLACASTPAPADEYALARAAIDAARVVESARYSPGFWHQAEESYKKAQAFFKNEQFSDAKSEFIKARTAAEKAENSARLLRFRSGEVL